MDFLGQEEEQKNGLDFLPGGTAKQAGGKAAAGAGGKAKAPAFKPMTGVFKPSKLRRVEEEDEDDFFQEIQVDNWDDEEPAAPAAPAGKSQEEAAAEEASGGEGEVEAGESSEKPPPRIGLTKPPRAPARPPALKNPAPAQQPQQLEMASEGELDAGSEAEGGAGQALLLELGAGGGGGEAELEVEVDFAKIQAAEAVPEPLSSEELKGVAVAEDDQHMETAEGEGSAAEEEPAMPVGGAADPPAKQGPAADCESAEPAEQQLQKKEQQREQQAEVEAMQWAPAEGGDEDCQQEQQEQGQQRDEPPEGEEGVPTDEAPTQQYLPAPSPPTAAVLLLQQQPQPAAAASPAPAAQQQPAKKPAGAADAVAMPPPPPRFQLAKPAGTTAIGTPTHQVPSALHRLGAAVAPLALQPKGRVGIATGSANGAPMTSVALRASAAAAAAASKAQLPKPGAAALPPKPAAALTPLGRLGKQAGPSLALAGGLARVAAANAAGHAHGGIPAGLGRFSSEAPKPKAATPVPTTPGADLEDRAAAAAAAAAEEARAAEAAAAAAAAAAAVADDELLRLDFGGSGRDGVLETHDERCLVSGALLVSMAPEVEGGLQALDQMLIDAERLRHQLGGLKVEATMAGASLEVMDNPLQAARLAALKRKAEDACAAALAYSLPDFGALLQLLQLQQQQEEQRRLCGPSQQGQGPEGEGPDGQGDEGREDEPAGMLEDREGEGEGQGEPGAMLEERPLEAEAVAA